VIDSKTTTNWGRVWLATAVFAGCVLAAGVAAIPAHSKDPAGCLRCKPAAAFAPTQTLIASGRAVKLSGPIKCPAGDIVRVRATVSQRSTGAVAQAFWNKPCTGKGQHWHKTASVNDGVMLSAGCAHAAGLAIIRHAGKPVDAFQWLRTVTLKATGKTSAAATC
jgi:hypothetical protein